jgi:hypothetical protein
MLESAATKKRPVYAPNLIKERGRMIRKIFATDDNTTTAILRLVLGVVLFTHGAQKLLGWFGD